MVFKELIRLPLRCVAALLNRRVAAGLAASVLFFCTLVYAAEPRPAPPRATSVAGESPHLTQAQWDALFRAASKRIVSLRLRMILRQRIYVSRAMARKMASGVGKRQPKLGRLLSTAAGYRAETKLVRLDWNIPRGLVFARKIQIGGYVDVGPEGKRERGLAHATIWVVGGRSVWKAWPGGGLWNVFIVKRQSSWWHGDSPLESQNYGLDALMTIWKTPLQDMTGVKYRLAKQTYDPSTGLVKLNYTLLNPTRPSSTEKDEYHFEMKLAGGLRIYRAVGEVVGGPKGTMRADESDFRRFRKSGGVWFPTRIRERRWFDTRLVSDYKLKISHLVINGIFPPHTFRYTPPYGAMVTDSRTRPPSVYFIGSRKPNVPPPIPAGGTKGGNDK